VGGLYGHGTSVLRLPYILSLNREQRCVMVVTETALADGLFSEGPLHDQVRTPHSRARAGSVGSVLWSTKRPGGGEFVRAVAYGVPASTLGLLQALFVL
jgi:hypothetical protein